MPGLGPRPNGGGGTACPSFEWDCYPELWQRLTELPKGRPILIACAAGGRSAAACEFLSSQGFADLTNLEGGMSAWRGAVERPAEE